MFLALVLAAAIPEPAHAGRPVQARTTASVRILAPATGSKADWDRTPALRQKERIIIEADGEKRRVLVIEHE